MVTQTDTSTLPDRLDNPDAYAEIASYQDALALTQTVDTLDSDDLGDGFALTDKAELVGVEMMILDWSFHEGDYGEFCSVRAVTANGSRVVFNDGSAGIAKTLRSVTNSRNGEHVMIRARHGLRASHYESEYGPATTYYIAS